MIEKLHSSARIEILGGYDKERSTIFLTRLLHRGFHVPRNEVLSWGLNPDNVNHDNPVRAYVELVRTSVAAAEEQGFYAGDILRLLDVEEKDGHVSARLEDFGRRVPSGGLFYVPQSAADISELLELDPDERLFAAHLVGYHRMHPDTPLRPDADNTLERYRQSLEDQQST